MPNKMSSEEIREAFLRYFENKNHSRLASGSLIPVGDPTLLLTSAGMVPLKPFFSGDVEPENKRLTSSQKSFRTPDIDEVGDSTHLTLFEMLGNFSIGDYFKKEAISFSLELVTSELGLPAERFAITVHDSDEEAIVLWENEGIPLSRIYTFGDSDNWWGPAGDEGPCGPCSELHYDFGEERGCCKNDCGPNCQNIMNDDDEVCDRFVELWNLVFMQYYRHLDGSDTPLPAPSIDTGMGLERAAVILQNVDTIYETDLFMPMIQKAEELTGLKRGVDKSTDYAIATMAEHGRSSTFLIADGVIPSNEGRGYVLRRVIRRAIRNAWKLGLQEPFLGDIADVTIAKMSNVYPELKQHRDFILTVIRLEEERFQQVFQNGNQLLTETLEEVKELPGSLVFQLWDTFGFPVEMTQEIALERGVLVDLEEFQREMDAQRERGRASGQFGGDRAKIRVYEEMGLGSTKFLGYSELTSASPVVGLVSDGQSVDEVEKGEQIEILLLQTPFYPEGGGQVGDAGDISCDGGKILIHDTQEVMPGVIVHYGEVTQGIIKVGDLVQSYVNQARRADTARNHTATHLLHAALREILGPHVRQAGSLVAPDRLRFDFSHVKPLSDDELRQVQKVVNRKIRQNAEIIRGEDTYQSAVDRGALAFFGDRYGERVRLVEIANGQRFSFEVCGGTHVDHTGEIGAVYILGESSIGAGMRRLEAVSGRAAESLVLDRFKREDNVARRLQTGISEIENRLDELLIELDQLKRQNESLEKRSALQQAEVLLGQVRDVEGISLLSVEVDSTNQESLREISDWLRDKMGSGMVVLGSVVEGRPIIHIALTSDLVSKGFDARIYAKELGKVIGGGGGGRQDTAQAGGRYKERLKEAIGSVDELIGNALDN